MSRLWLVGGAFPGSWSKTMVGRLAAEDVSVAVVDLRTIVPLDLDTVARSVRQTRRLVVAAVAESMGGRLLATPRRVGADAVPAPYAAHLERAWLPGADAVEQAVRDVLTASVRG